MRGGGDELGMPVLVTAACLAGVLLFAAAYVVGEKPFNRTCPVTGQWVGPVSVADIAGDLSEDERRAEADALNAAVDALVTATRTHGGYVISFSSEQAARTWDGYDAARKDDYLLGNNARPGWLAGFPPLLRAAAIALVGVAWIWLAGIIIAQCTGMTDWSPISGMALLTVVLVMLLGGTGAVVGAVLIGAALCVAITLAADMMTDLRTGHLVGAQPRRQQVLELLVVGIGPLVSMLVVLLIAEANRQSFGVPFGPETPTSAPQAQALQAVITGVQGGEMPYALYGFGALLGALLGLSMFRRPRRAGRPQHVPAVRGHRHLRRRLRRQHAGGAPEGPRVGRGLGRPVRCGPDCGRVVARHDREHDRPGDRLTGTVG